MRIGILGGGQLGRMLALAAHRLDLEPVVLEPRPGAPASAVARSIEADYDDRWALEELASCDVVTWELEHVPAASIRQLAELVPVHPSPESLEQTSDRWLEKRLLRSLGIPTARFRAVDSRADLDRAVAEIGLPAVLKTRRFGYDGRGQRLLLQRDALDEAWRELGGRPLLLEEHIAFDREISLIAVRGRDDSVLFWPASENVHVDGLLRIARSPATGIGPAGLLRARAWVEALLRRLDYVGVAVVEFFVQGEHWIANEVACRVHNSGHWTLEASPTSQFENHLRAVTGLPLGSTDGGEAAAMLNLVGRMPPLRELLAIPGAHLHRYGKEPRPDRKLGHLTLRDPSARALEARVAAAVRRIGDPALATALARTHPRPGARRRSGRRPARPGPEPRSEARPAPGDG